MDELCACGMAEHPISLGSQALAFAQRIEQWLDHRERSFRWWDRPARPIDQPAMIVTGCAGKSVAGEFGHHHNDLFTLGYGEPFGKIAVGITPDAVKHEQQGSGRWRAGRPHIPHGQRWPGPSRKYKPLHAARGHRIGHRLGCLATLGFRGTGTILRDSLGAAGE